MRFLLMYFGSRVVNDVRTYIYTSRKSYKASMNVNGTSESFSMTYFNGQPKAKDQGSFTVWLNDKSVEEVELIRKVYGDECYLQVNEHGEGTLISADYFNALPKDEQNVVTASQIAI